MSDYLDTSAIVAAVTLEAASFRVADWMAAQSAPLFISTWVETEFAAALSMKIRTATLDLERREDIIRKWHIMLHDNFIVDSVEPAHFTLAARFAQQHELGLRAGDALHLAIAFTNGHRIVTLDRRMTEAAPHLGLETLMP